MKARLILKQTVLPAGVLAALIAIAILICMQGGCAGMQTQEDPAVSVGRLAGVGLKILVDMKAPEQALALQGLAAVSLGLLQGRNVDLAGITRDAMILVQEISASAKIDRYAREIENVGGMFSGLIRLNWDVPEEYQRARAILRAFFEGVRGAD